MPGGVTFPLIKSAPDSHPVTVFTMRYFETPMVRAMTGASRSELRYWSKTGLVHPLHRRRGLAMLWSSVEIMRVKVIHELMEAGWPLVRIRRAMS